MKIIAQKEGGEILLVGDENQSSVWDTTQNIRYPAFNTQSILARGYWVAYTGSQDKLKDFERVKEVTV